jgi:hypothetical protein
VVPIVVSGVLAPGWLRSPVTRLREQPKDRQKVAEAFQVMQQLLFPGSLRTNPLITFGPALPAVDLLRPDSAVSPLQAIVEHQRTLLLLHQHLRSSGLAPWRCKTKETIHDNPSSPWVIAKRCCTAGAGAGGRAVGWLRPAGAAHCDPNRHLSPRGRPAGLYRRGDQTGCQQCGRS